MKSSNLRKVVLLTLLTAGLILPGTALAGKAPPPPGKVGGGPVKRFATGVGIPTQIAFSGGRAFVAGAAEGPFKGGLFVVRSKAAKAVKIPGTGRTAFGVAARGGRIYVSSGPKVTVYSRFDGKRFRRSRTIFNGGRKFNGFSGLAIGPNGRLYAGVSLNQKYDNTADPGRFGNSIVSMGLSGRNLKVISSGLRQPWMMTFAKGIRDPFVSVLGQDVPASNGAPDLIVRARPGANFGFPKCNWLESGDCAGFDQPLVELDAWPGLKDSLNQQSPMGIGAAGGRLYVALFSGTAEAGPQVMTVKTDGTDIRPFMTGFAAPVLSVAIHGGRLYTGDLTGTIYSTALR